MTSGVGLLPRLRWGGERAHTHSAMPEVHGHAGPMCQSHRPACARPVKLRVRGSAPKAGSQLAVSPGASGQVYLKAGSRARRSRNSSVKAKHRYDEKRQQL